METTVLRPARWWATRPDGRVECLLCPRFCKLQAGQKGFCGVRHNDNGEMVLDTYGHTSGLAVDPVEKKPLFHFLPGSRILSFGTSGCNLACSFCQNWKLSRSAFKVEESIAASPQEIARAAEEEGCPSVAFTYNDPVIFAEYAIDTARACHERGLMAVAVSAGFINAEARTELFSEMDAANIDLKAFSDDYYRSRCGGRLQPVLDTLVGVKKEGRTWLEVTTLLIPGLNDDDGQLDRASDWFAANLGPDVPWHFSAFHPNYKMRDRPWTPRATLERARALAMSKGINYVYTGNVRSDEGSRTLCPSCHAELITREGFHVTSNKLNHDCCPGCGVKIPGVFQKTN
jgi:pyruvate formate lyase activating enzyme